MVLFFIWVLGSMAVVALLIAVRMFYIVGCTLADWYRGWRFRRYLGRRVR